MRPLTIAATGCVCALMCVAPSRAHAQSAPDEPPPIQRFLKTIGRDLKTMVSADSVPLLSSAAALALLVSPFDDNLTYSASCSTFLKTSFEGWARKSGQEWFLGSAALATYAAGRVIRDDRLSAIGGDLVEAQIVAGLTTGAIKYVVSRTRPDGEARSFPSGHAAGTFATAAVLQRHLGLKGAIPAYTAAVLISGARLQANSHYSTDVIIGAAIGVLAGRSATFEIARSRVTVSPSATPGGGAISFNVEPGARE